MQKAFLCRFLIFFLFQRLSILHLQEQLQLPALLASLCHLWCWITIGHTLSYFIPTRQNIMACPNLWYLFSKRTKLILYTRKPLIIVILPKIPQVNRLNFFMNGCLRTPQDMDGTLTLIFAELKTTWDITTKISVSLQLS